MRNPILPALALLAALSAAAVASPCTDQPAWRQFDFWLGTWNVLDGDSLVGTNRITRDTGDCIVHESYAQGDGYTGRSINFFDPVTKRWRQTWVDCLGNVSEFSGEYTDGAMRFEGESHRAGGQRILRTMTLFNNADGTVRQVSRQSKDGGATWTDDYDFTYVRVE